MVAQEVLFIKYIVDRGWTLVEIYSDSLTATKGNRPGFEKMVRDAKENKFDVIIAKELSRLARNIGTSADFKKIIMSNDIDIITLDGAIDTTKGDVSKYGLYAWIYEEESRRTSNRIKTSFKTSAEKGRYLKGEAPYGYDVSDGKLYPREDNSVSVVQLIYKMYLEGHGRDSIAKYLTTKGYQTPAMLKGKSNAGIVLHGTTVMVVLRNRHYIGDLEQCKETTKDITLIGRKKLDESVIVENTHEGIISRADYFSVQAIIKNRGLKTLGRATPKKSLFGDLLYCSDCSSKFWFINTNNSNYMEDIRLLNEYLIENENLIIEREYYYIILGKYDNYYGDYIAKVDIDENEHHEETLRRHDELKRVFPNNNLPSASKNNEKNRSEQFEFSMRNKAKMRLFIIENAVKFNGIYQSENEKKHLASFFDLLDSEEKKHILSNCNKMSLDQI